MDLTTHDFDRLRTMVLAHSAIVLEAGKEYLVAQIDGPDSARVCGLIVDAMTTNETSFFRDTHPWDEHFAEVASTWTIEIIGTRR